MDIDRIAIVLHSAVLKKLQNEFRIPETLTQEQVQAAYDRVYDILQQSIMGRDIKSNKIDIQKEATLRSIQEIPIAIREATKTFKQSPEPPQDTPADIQNLVEQELQKRGMQDQNLGATPPTPTGREQFNEIQLSPPTQNDTLTTNSFTPDRTGSGGYDNVNPPPFVQETPRPLTASLPPDSFEPVSTFISSPDKGTDGLRWEFESKSPILGITYVRLPHLFVSRLPYLLIHITNDGTIMKHPLIHTTENWYKVPNGKNCLGRLTGSFRVSITDPDGEVIRTKYTLREAQNNHTFYTKAVIDPKTDIAHTYDDIDSQQTKNIVSKDEEPENKEESTEVLSPDDEVILLFDDHSIDAFFLTSSV